MREGGAQVSTKIMTFMDPHTQVSASWHTAGQMSGPTRRVVGHSPSMFTRVRGYGLTERPSCWLACRRIARPSCPLAVSQTLLHAGLGVGRPAACLPCTRVWVPASKPVRSDDCTEGCCGMCVQVGHQATRAAGGATCVLVCGATDWLTGRQAWQPTERLARIPAARVMT